MSVSKKAGVVCPFQPEGAERIDFGAGKRCLRGSEAETPEESPFLGRCQAIGFENLQDQTQWGTGMRAT